MTGSGRTATMLALGAIVALGAVLRAWGIGYGLPHTLTRPDEEMVAARALAMLQTGRLDPVTFFYPSLFVYLDAAALRAWLAVGVWLGRYRGLDDFLVGMLRGPLVHFLLARALSAAFGTGTVVVAYFLGRRAGSGRPAGLLAALAVATCYLHARDAHFAKADVLMGFFVALALLFAARAAEGGRLRDFAWGGLCVGLAASAKYNGALAAASLVAAAAFRLGRQPLASVLRPLCAAGALSVAAFLATSPYVLVRGRAFRAALGHNSFLLYSGGGALALWEHARVTLPVGLGWGFTAAAAAGVAWAAWTRSRPGLVLLAFVLPWCVFAATVRLAYPRYVTPLVAPLAVLAAAFVCAWARAPAARALAGVALALPGLVRTVQFDRVAAATDTRVLAAEWIDGNLPRRSELLVCAGYGAPEVNEDRRRPPAFRPRTVRCTDPAVLEGAPPFVVTAEHPALGHWTGTPAVVAAAVRARGVPLAVFSPFREGAGTEPYFSPADAFFIPFSGLSAVERGGPIVTIWQIP